jgi:hypothetical protein
VRFVWAVVAFLVAVGLIGTGVARLALASEPDTVTSPIAAADAELPYTVIDADVLSAYPGQQGLTISDSENEIFVSYGRTSDIKAWLSDTSYNHAALADGRAENGEPKVSVEVVDATNAYSDTGERVWWNPRDSDLWIEQLTAEDSLQRDFALPEGMSLLIATDGTAPAPADVSVTWQTGAITTPWAGPLIAAGCLALLIGLVFWILGFIHLRRRRGPRRKGSSTPGGRGGRRASRASARRALWAIPTVTVAGALLAGCTPSAWPDFSNDRTRGRDAGGDGCAGRADRRLDGAGARRRRPRDRHRAGREASHGRGVRHAQDRVRDPCRCRGLEASRRSAGRARERPPAAGERRLASHGAHGRGRCG